MNHDSIREPSVVPLTVRSHANHNSVVLRLDCDNPVRMLQDDMRRQDGVAAAMKPYGGEIEAWEVGAEVGTSRARFCPAACP